LFEETFHALDYISDDRKSAETIAAIGRYYMIKLFNKKYKMFESDSLEQLFSWVTGYKVKFENGEMTFWYNPSSKDESMYSNRIPLSKDIYEIEKKSWNENYSMEDMKEDLRKLIRKWSHE